MSKAPEIPPLTVTMTHGPGRVLVQFEARVSWMSLTPLDAMKMAQMLIYHARHADPESSFTLAIDGTAQITTVDKPPQH